MLETSDKSEKLLVRDFQNEEDENFDMKKIFNNEYNTSEHASDKYFVQTLNVDSVQPTKKTSNGENKNGETINYPQKKRTQYYNIS